MEEKKKNKIWLSAPTRSMVLRSLANWCVIVDCRGYPHLCTAISMLRASVGEETIKKHYGKNYEKLNNILIEFSQKVLYISHYFDFLKDKDYRDSSVFNEHYRNYLQALSWLPIIHVPILEFLNFLINQTELHDKSIPSDYLKDAQKELINFEIEDKTPVREHYKKFENYPREDNEHATD